MAVQHIQVHLVLVLVLLAPVLKVHLGELLLKPACLHTLGVLKVIAEEKIAMLFVGNGLVDRERS